MFAERERLAFDEDVQLRHTLSPEALANRPVTIPFFVGRRTNVGPLLRGDEVRSPT